MTFLQNAEKYLYYDHQKQYLQTGISSPKHISFRWTLGTETVGNHN